MISSKTFIPTPVSLNWSATGVEFYNLDVGRDFQIWGVFSESIEQNLPPVSDYPSEFYTV